MVWIIFLAIGIICNVIALFKLYRFRKALKNLEQITTEELTKKWYKLFSLLAFWVTLGVISFCIATILLH
ncbi:hypothetical protein CN601_26085 [Bacillus sp. AFS017336]|nr:hypothetical protein CN601_26085 [Bacillus sp. AFS017336]